VNRDVTIILDQSNIQPSAQRIAVAQYVFNTEDHPSADQVLACVSASFPYISRATVYNTLNLFVEKGLLRELYLAEGKVVFDSNLDKHHHFIEETSGAIHDIPWDQVQVSNVKKLKGYEVSDYQVVLRGKLSKANTGKK
jgi:Fur family iron response transcriptional regulator